MDDVQFMTLAGDAIRYVDEKFGRAAAWAAAILLIVVPIGLIVSIVGWLAF